MKSNPPEMPKPTEIVDNIIIQSEAKRRASEAKPNPGTTELLKRLHKEDPEGFLNKMAQAAIDAAHPKK